MSRYKTALEAFLLSAGERPSWDRHVPDELCSHIETLADFQDFLSFANQNLRSDRLEYGCEDTAEFLDQLNARLASPQVQEWCDAKGIGSDFGRLAYAFILALGNPSAKIPP